MSYVPPHLRNSTPVAATEAGTTTVTTLDANTFHSYSKLNCTANHHSNNHNHVNHYCRTVVVNFTSSRTHSAADVVFPLWKPSERVLRLSPDQINEVRFRLNVEVVVGPDSPPAPAPIESFQTEQLRLLFDEKKSQRLRALSV